MQALCTSGVCLFAALIWLITAAYFNKVVEHSMLRGQAYTDAVRFCWFMLVVDCLLIAASVYYFFRAVNLENSGIEQ